LKIKFIKNAVLTNKSLFVWLSCQINHKTRQNWASKWETRKMENSLRHNFLTLRAELRWWRVNGKLCCRGHP